MKRKLAFRIQQVSLSSQRFLTREKALKKNKDLPLCLSPVGGFRRRATAASHERFSHNDSYPALGSPFENTEHEINNNDDNNGEEDDRGGRRKRLLQLAAVTAEQYEQAQKG